MLVSIMACASRASSELGLVHGGLGSLDLGMATRDAGVDHGVRLARIRRGHFML